MHQNLAFWSARADQLEQMAADEPIEEHYPGAKSKKLPRRKSPMRVKAIISGAPQEIPSSPEHEKEVEVLEPADLRKADGSLDPYHPSWVVRMQKAMEKKLQAEKGDRAKQKSVKEKIADTTNPNQMQENFENTAATQMLESAKQDGVLQTRRPWLRLATWREKARTTIATYATSGQTVATCPHRGI